MEHRIVARRRNDAADDADEREANQEVIEFCRSVNRRPQTHTDDLTGSRATRPIRVAFSVRAVSKSSMEDAAPRVI